jgi:cyclopropane fatty-acyl-phospholipid synthase-like methyltransferase
MQKLNYKEILNYYNQSYINNYSHNEPMFVGWDSEEAQYHRYRALVGIGIENGDSVLDLGCGIGGMYSYLMNSYENIKYTGLDINPNYIYIANMRYPGIEFIAATIDEMGDNTYDYLVASGLFSVGFCIVDILAYIKKALTKTVKGLSFNLLNSNNFTGNNILSGFNPDTIFNLVNDLFPSCKVTMVSGYLPDDFTIYVRK